MKKHWCSMPPLIISALKCSPPPKKNCTSPPTSQHYFRFRGEFRSVIKLPKRQRERRRGNWDTATSSPFGDLPQREKQEEKGTWRRRQRKKAPPPLRPPAARLPRRRRRGIPTPPPPPERGGKCYCGEGRKARKQTSDLAFRSCNIGRSKPGKCPPSPFLLFLRRFKTLHTSSTFSSLFRSPNSPWPNARTIFWVALFFFGKFSAKIRRSCCKKGGMQCELFGLF